MKTLPVAALLCTLALCASAQDILPAPASIHAEGVPPIEKATADRIGQYTQFRGKPLAAWHPARREMLVAFRAGNTTQIHLLRTPMGGLEQLTDYPDPVRAASFEPRRGDYIVFLRDAGGDEATQVYRMDLPSRQVVRLTNPEEKHGIAGWNNAEDALLLISTQLDRTAQGGRRDNVSSDLYAFDPAHPQDRRKIATLPGAGWFGFDWSPDDRTLVAVDYKSIEDSEVWTIDVATGERRKVLPLPGEKAASFEDVEWSHDGKGFYLTTDRDGEYRQLAYYDLATKAFRNLTKDIAWDVVSISSSRDRRHMAITVNEAGMTTLRLFDPVARRMLPAPRLPAGSVGTPLWTRDGAILGFPINSVRGPSETWAFDTAAGTLAQWTAADNGGMDTGGFRDIEIVKWKSFDGLEINGLMVRPPERFKGPRPVLIEIHGGPESQSTVGFIGRYNYYVNELGITLLMPNVRGSSGYGKTFLSLDNGRKREDSVRDIGALLDWVATRPELDAGRVMAIGGSYGGYMSLAVSTNYADRIRGAIDVVGISHFVTFLERTETYRRDLRRAEYGDERDPAMRAFLDRISPLTNAHKIKKPLFVVQGRNDPRVPYQEAEQIVTKARANETPVWYMIADNEGHGFARKNNADYLFYSQVKFIEQYLLK